MFFGFSNSTYSKQSLYNSVQMEFVMFCVSLVIQRTFQVALVVKGATCRCRRPKWIQFNLWVWKIPWRSTWQPTSVFLPGECYGQRSLGRLWSMGSQRVGHDWSDLAQWFKNFFQDYLISIHQPLKMYFVIKA